MFPISSSSSYFIRKKGLRLILANGFLFHRCQFSLNFFQYSCSYFFSPHPYNNFAVYFLGNPLLYMFFSSSLSYLRVSSSSSLPYSFSNSSTNSLAFLRFSLLSCHESWHENFSFLCSFYFYFSIFRMDLHNWGSHMGSHMTCHMTCHVITVGR